MRHLIFTLCALVMLNNYSVFAAEELVVYSARKEHLIKPLFEAYTQQTGVPIIYITDSEGPLLEKIKAEGENTKADILITVDAGNLWHAGNEGIFTPIESEILEMNIPSHLKDPTNLWFGFSIRARTIVYNTEKIIPSDLSTYEALADSNWKGRLCLRTSKKVYNQSLVAMMIENDGVGQVEKVLRGWVDNLAAPVFSNDTKVMEAIAAGQCDVGIVNSYYFGRLKQEKPDIPLMLFWPNQNGAGVHVNVSGAGIVKYSQNKEKAILFLEWLSGEEAQRMFADANLEYPVNPEVKPHEEVSAWGTFKQNEMNISKTGALQKESVMLMDRVGYK